MSKFKKQYYRNVVCPYCGYEDDDSWDISLRDEDTDIRECGMCEKKFHTTCHISRTFDCIPDCELNGEQHKWHESVDFGDGETYGECEICGKIRILSDRSIALEKQE